MSTRIARDMQWLVDENDDLIGYRKNDSTQVLIGTTVPERAAAVVGAKIKVASAGLSAYSPSEYEGLAVYLTDYNNLEVVSDGTAWRAARQQRIGGSGEQVASSATTVEEALASLVIPASILGSTGSLRVRTWVSSSAGTGNRDLFIRFGTQLLGEGRLAAAATPAAVAMVEFQINNLTATTQEGPHATMRTYGEVSAAPAFKSGTVNTAVAQTVQIISKKSVAGDEFILRRWEVEIVPPFA